MRGWAVVRNGQPLEAVEVTTPEPTGTQVLLKTTFCGVCHSDLYFQDGYYDLGGGKRLSLQDRGVTLPFIPGHETVGKVVAFGPQAKGGPKPRNGVVKLVQEQESQSVVMLRERIERV